MPLLGAAPEAGGIIFAVAGQVWRYDGARGSVDQIGTTGHLSADRRGYVVRTEEGPWRYVDAATGGEVVIGPAAAAAADAIPAGAKGVTGAFVQDGALWAYPRDGKPVLLESSPASSQRIEGSIGSVRADPTGTYLALFVSRDGGASELWTRDLSNGIVRKQVSIAAGDVGGVRSSLVPATWSPDGRYLAFLTSSTSNSINADGAALSVVNVENGSRTDLGVILGSAARLSWTTPHTIAYTIAGAGRFTWDRQTLRVWSPESGAKDVTRTGTIGLNPSWSADGRTLYFIGADSTAIYEPLDFFAGRGSGARSVVAHDVATGAARTFLGPSKYVTEGVRPTAEGTSLLVMQRVAIAARSLAELPGIGLELTLLDATTLRGRQLLRISSDAGFGYYGLYSGPEGMAWSLGR